MVFDRPSVVLLIVAIAALLALTGILVTRTLSASSPRIDVPAASDVALDNTAAARRLAEAVRLRTISPDDPHDLDPRPFLGFQDFLGASYPGVHRTLTQEVVNKYSLLYTWKGTDPGRKPILLMAHLDVVPVEPGTEGDWVQPPFSGTIADGFVWGRGAIDDKCAVLGILEAVEFLVGQGFRPSRTVFLAFGHDEEIRGDEGARKIAAILRSRDVALDYVLDEGLVIGDNLIPGVRRPVAMIGTAEKGWLTLELTATDRGGHASMPPRQTAVGILAAAIQRLEANPMPAALTSPVTELFVAAAPEMPFVRRLAFANIWLFGPVVRRQLARSPATDAAIRTTTAVTVVQAGTRDNMLPKVATAVVNVRILPGDSSTSVTEHFRATINDPRVNIKAVKQEEPTPVSPTDAASFRTVATTIRQVFPGVLVVPGLVLARTDSAHYVGMADAVYRFRPLTFTPGDLSRIHGTNERLAVDGYAALIRFYVQLLRNSAG